MKKKLLAVMLALALLGSVITGCNSDGDTETTTKKGDDSVATTTTTAPVTTEDVELVVWESALGPDEWVMQAGEAFTALYPNITIKYVNVELGDSTSAIALDGPAGVGPDLFAAPHDKLGELVVGGHVLATSDADAVADAVLGACSSAITYDGVMYGYPTSAETYALYYNKDLISEDELPTTWSEMYEWTKTFNAANPDKYGFIMDVSNIYYTILFTTKGGNRLFGEGGADVSSSYLNTADAVAGVKEFQKMREVLPLASADCNTASADGSFAAGDAAMHISGPWNITNFKDAGINFGIAPLPALTGETTPAASFSGTRVMFVSAYSEHPVEAEMFANFLISEEMQQLRYTITGALPSIDIAVESEYSQGFIAQLDFAFPMPSVPQMSAFWASGNSASSNIWDGADVQAELDAFDAAIVSYVAE